MKFSGNMGMDISCTQKYIVTIEINQSSFYGNMFQYSINSLTYCDTTQKLFNLYEIGIGNGYGLLLHLEVHCYYRYQFVLFLWQLNCNVLSNFLLILLLFLIEYIFWRCYSNYRWMIVS